MNRLRYLNPYHLVWLLAMICCSCDIKDDLPLPYTKAEITEFEVEGQCDETGLGKAEAVIDKERRVVEAYVNDGVDLSQLHIERLAVSGDATVTIGGTDITFKPSSMLLPTLDFTHDVVLTLNTYHKFEWKIRVKQVIAREIEVENQVGKPVIDDVNHNVVIYVAPTQRLSQIKVLKMKLGGPHGTVTPDPTGQVLDFTRRRQFTVTNPIAQWNEKWDVYVYNAEKNTSATANVFPFASRAYVSGDIMNGTMPVVEYRKQGDEEWLTLASDQIVTTSTTYEAEITGLVPGSDYECQVTAGGTTSSIQRFTTYPAIALENGSFDNWHIEGSGKQALYNPWAEGGTRFWDTGNRGATTVGSSNSTYVSEGGRTYANLQSKYIVIKFAAGNIFTGQYLKTDGTNGVLSFGRPFESFPTHLKFDYKFHSSIINKGGGKWDDSYSKYISQSMYDQLRGQPDSCQVFVALIGNQDEEQYEGVTYPYIIRTRPSELHLFNTRSDNVIGYAQLTQGNDVNDWKTETLTIQYRRHDRVPKYIVVVASSSKYGDYFVGGDETLLQLDNVELLYK